MSLPDISNQTLAATSKEKLEILLSIGAGKIIEKTLNKLIFYQLAKYRESIESIKPELEKFENRYRMTSDQFYRDFEAGKLGDDSDYFEWSGLYENILLYNERINKLEAV